jgi:hypothetical protein
MGKLGLNSGYIGSDQRITTSGVVGYDKYYLERKAGRFTPSLNFSGLLDQYPSASAAYSLRLLSSTYGGPAVRVRRSSDNSEQDISFTGGILNTDELTTFCNGSNGFVTTWYDQSGNGVTLTQSSLLSQPQIVSTGNVLLDNNKPVVQFDGSNDVLSSTSITNVFNNSSIFSVVNITPNGSEDIPFGYGLTGQSMQVRCLYVAPSQKLAFAGWSNDFISSIDASSANIYLFSLIQNSTAISIRRNTTTSTGTLGNSLNSTITAAYSIGSLAGTSVANYYAQMKGSEFIFYPSNQTDNRTGIESNINLYYAIY